MSRRHHDDEPSLSRLSSLRWNREVRQRPRQVAHMFLAPRADSSFGAPVPLVDSDEIQPLPPRMRAFPSIEWAATVAGPLLAESVGRLLQHPWEHFDNGSGTVYFILVSNVFSCMCIGVTSKPDRDRGIREPHVILSRFYLRTELLGQGIGTGMMRNALLGRGVTASRILYVPDAAPITAHVILKSLTPRLGITMFSHRDTSSGEPEFEENTSDYEGYRGAFVYELDPHPVAIQPAFDAHAALSEFVTALMAIPGFTFAFKAEHHNGGSDRTLMTAPA